MTARGGASGWRGGGLPAMAGIEPRCTKIDGKCMERKRRRRGSLPRDRRGGGSTGDGGLAAVAAGGGGVVVREVRKGGARGGEEVLMPLCRVEEEGEEAHKGVGGSARRGRRRSSPGHRRRRRLGATGHHLRHGLDREQEEDSAKLTNFSMMAVRRCRRRAAMRSGRDHGCPPGRMLRPRLRAPGRRVLVRRSGRRGRTRGC
jgi:hypothetical protein